MYGNKTGLLVTQTIRVVECTFKTCGILIAMEELQPDTETVCPYCRNPFRPTAMQIRDVLILKRRTE